MAEIPVPVSSLLNLCSLECAHFSSQFDWELELEA